jgi:GNAT superfamily N-acetyltransferase
MVVKIKGKAMITLKRTDSGNTDFRQLVVELDKELAVRDGDEHAFYSQFNNLDTIKNVVVAYDGAEPVGCGAIKEYTDNIMEIKRMFVPLDRRGEGIASIVLKELENWASELGAEKCVLETGLKQPEAIRLYEKTGYCSIPNYGQYIGVENSVCFKKDLTIIIHAATTGHIETARRLFREYEAWFGLDLCFQDFEGEVRDLPGKYAPPEGRLLLANVGEVAAGCVALRKLGDGICEMKRLFVRDEFRGLGIGVALIERIIDEGRSIGYKKLRLDTFAPKMGKAVELYRSHGFREIAPYYHNPYAADVLFMELDL